MISTAIVANTEAPEVDFLARLLRLEAKGDGELGMLVVGNKTKAERACPGTEGIDKGPERTWFSCSECPLSMPRSP